MALLQRNLRATFQIAGNAKNQFAKGNNTIVFENLRMTMKVVKAGGAVQNSLQGAIFGMTLSEMNTLSTLGLKVALIPKNTVTLEAGDAVNGMFIVFQGTIYNAYADFGSAPDVAFRVTAQGSGAAAVAPVAATSYQGAVDINTICKGLSAQMGLKFESNVGAINIADPYYSGSAYNQAQRACRAAGVSLCIDNGTLAIFPKFGARAGGMADINPQNGMIGYPAFTQDGLRVQTIFNPSIVFNGKVKVTSSLKPACGVWNVNTLDHSLDCQMPNGKWETTLGLYSPNDITLTR